MWVLPAVDHTLSHAGRHRHEAAVRAAHRLLCAVAPYALLDTLPASRAHTTKPQHLAALLLCTYCRCCCYRPRCTCL
jgi:hypothetical protein